MSHISRTFKLDETTEATLKIELSAQETRETYLEQEFIYDREDIMDELERLAEDEDEPDICGMPFADITDRMIDDMACEKRRQMDKYGVDWDYARDEAIGMIVKREIAKQGETAA